MTDLRQRIEEVLRREIRTALNLKPGDYFPSELFERAADAVLAVLQPEIKELSE